MAGPPPALELCYPDPESFRHDYEADLSNGGAFVPTRRRLELRERVEVRLRLEWCGREIALSGEVVHVVPPEMSELGGKPGVAVQFSSSAYEVRDQLAPLVFEREPTRAVPGQGADTRQAPRKAARVAARVAWSGGEVVGCTRNLSRSGVLIGVQEGEVPKGEPVTVTLQRPGGGGEFEVGGRVMRQVKSEGRVTALGIQFRSDEASREAVDAFLHEVMGAEHTRRLGAISGPIAELGPHGIVQMLATSAPRGTIVLRSGEEEGLICFEGGLLRRVRLGAATGMEALVPMLAWREGTFEFTTGIEEEGAEAPLPLEAAVLDAVRQLDEAAAVDAVRQLDEAAAVDAVRQLDEAAAVDAVRQLDEAAAVDPARFPLQARLVRARRAAERDRAYSTIEEALLDLAQAGFTVSRALEVIPEPDVKIFRAISALVDAKELELH